MMYFVVNARLVGEKAHVIQVRRMEEALRRHSALVLVGPAQLHVPNWYGRGRYWFALSSLIFMLASLCYLWAARVRHGRITIYTVDMDTFSYALLPLAGPTFAEMHSPKRATLLNKFFFRRVAGVIATTPHTKEALRTTFGVPEGRVIVEPNGVSDDALASNMEQAQARERLGLPAEPFALYVGRIYAWKGLEVLPDAAQYSPLAIYVVGGTGEEFKRVVGKEPGKLKFAGIRPKEEVALWLAAADMALVLGTARNDDSYYYTSPMKVFEYLAARRPVVASRTPALTSAIPESAASWYEPDNAASLVQAMEQAHSAGKEHMEEGYALAAQHTWNRRAERILAFISAADSLSK